MPPESNDKNNTKKPSNHSAWDPVDLNPQETAAQPTVRLDREKLRQAMAQQAALGRTPQPTVPKTSEGVPTTAQPTRRIDIPQQQQAAQTPPAAPPTQRIEIPPSVPPTETTQTAPPSAYPTQRIPPVAQPTRRIKVPLAVPAQPPVAPPTRRITLPPETTHPAESATYPTQRIPPVAPPTRRMSPPAPEPSAVVPPASPDLQPTQRMTPPTHFTPGLPTATGSPPSQPAANSVTPRQAWEPSTIPTKPVSSPSQTPPAPPTKKPPRTRPQRAQWASWLLGLTLIGVFVFFLGLIASVVGYIIIAAQLPSPDDLNTRQPNFASSQLYDRDGHLLHELIDPSAGKRTYVPISQISDYLKLATVATEDRNYYIHGGFDPIAIARAIYYALQERAIVSGASTITQQVARNVLLPEEAAEQTASRKIKEIILAAELERKYSKDEILEIYVNNNNYGNLAYGVDAAARTYFGTSAAYLDLSQGAFLAGIPQLPSVYDPYHGGKDAVLKRHKIVLGLMVEAGFITQKEADEAADAMDAYEFKPIFTDRIPAPHFVMYVQQWLETELGPEMLYTGRGLRIHTTLDGNLQHIAEEETANGVAALADMNVNNGALVAIEPASGHILAMVGSADFYDNDIGGQVNVTLRCRQPGSSIKPLTFLAAFEKGWNPATIVWDVPTIYTDTWGNRYEPVNYDGRFRGPTSVRTALANSLNLPAVKALEYITVDGLLEIAERLGATSIVTPQLECPDYPADARPFYGLALTLGGGELKPLELTSAYATLANGGLRMSPTPILWVEDRAGNILVDNRQRHGEPVVASEMAYLITNILSDTKARCLVFACPNNLELPDRPVAAKTGTTNDNRDAWTMGYTPDIAVGVWVGNNDNSQMAAHIGGSNSAGVIWNAFMRRAHEGVPSHSFPRPAGIVDREVCVLSGAEPSSYCPEKRSEVFSLNHLPPKANQDWFRQIEIDANSNLLANEFCRTHVVSKIMVDLSQISDPLGRAWMQEWAGQRGLEIAPTEYCTAEDSKSPQVVITEPSGDAPVTDLIDIWGTVQVPDFDRYEITFGKGITPGAWGWISGPHPVIVQNGRLGSWQIPHDLEPGTYTLRIVAFNKRGAQFEARKQLSIVAPTPTPTLTPLPTFTPLPTGTPTPTLPPTPTLQPRVTPTLPLPTPTSTPLPIPKPIIDPTPTVDTEA